MAGCTPGRPESSVRRGTADWLTGQSAPCA